MDESHQSAKHPWERSDDECCECRFSYCSTCLIYSNGPDRPPLCLDCALRLSGVRSTGKTKPRISWRQSRREAREAREAREGKARSNSPASPPAQPHRPHAPTPSWATLDDEQWQVDDA